MGRKIRGRKLHRRNFFELSEALAASQAKGAPPAGRTRIKLGTQHGESDQILRIMSAFGVTHLWTVRI